MRTRIAFLSLSLSIVLLPSVSPAQWPLDGTPVSTAVNTQWDQVIVADGAGGAVMAWGDARNGSNYFVYAQKINGSGIPQWTADGVPAGHLAADQQFPQIASDGAGGVFLAWVDWRNGFTDIYAQRLNASGAPMWAVNGVAVCIAADDQRVSTIQADGSGGAIIMWGDRRSGSFYKIYAQRMNAAGVPQWAANGVALSNGANDQQDPQMVSDGAGGMIVAWYDDRNFPEYDIYAQRVNASGASLWGAAGVPVCNASNVQGSQKVVSDGSGGAIVTWNDFRYGSSDIFAQRLNGSGVPQWTLNGIAVSAAAGNQDRPAIVADGAGGAIVAWDDTRSGSSMDIYAQRMSATGSPLWAGDGVALSTAYSDQNFARIASDGAGGGVVTWNDYRNGSNSDVYAQRVNATGTVQWSYDGVAVSTAAGYQSYPDIVSDGAGGAIAGWLDGRAGVGPDIYAQRVEGTYGYWGHPEPVVTSVKDIRNDQGGKVAVNWTASGRDAPVPRTISYYTIWRATNTLPLSESAEAPKVLTDIRQVRADDTGPLYLMSPTSSYYWELVGTQAAHGWPGYTYSASTRADSLAGSPATETFMVAAQIQYDDYVAFPSNAVSGHSVDNLAPAPPLMLTAQRVGPDVQLKWNGVHVPDLRDYSVYRKTSAGVTPVPINFLSAAADTLLIDASAPTSALYYIVTAYDVHANQSGPSNEASVSPTTNVGDPPSITRLTVLPNRPNPFTSATEFEVGLPAPSDVEVEIYDVAGRRVSTLEMKRASAGWQRIPFSGQDDRGRALASGVYFYRVTANGSTITNKMVIAR